MNTFNRKRQIMEHQPKSTAQDEIIEMAIQAGLSKGHRTRYATIS
jgi:hypothetical protein